MPTSPAWQWKTVVVDPGAVVDGVVEDERPEHRNPRHAEQRLSAVLQGPLHHELAVGDVEIEIFKIVLLGAANMDEFAVHGSVRDHGVGPRYG